MEEEEEEIYCQHDDNNDDIMVVAADHDNDNTTITTGDYEDDNNNHNHHNNKNNNKNNNKRKNNCNHNNNSNKGKDDKDDDDDDNNIYDDDDDDDDIVDDAHDVDEGKDDLISDNNNTTTNNDNNNTNKRCNDKETEKIADVEVDVDVTDDIDDDDNNDNNEDDDDEDEDEDEANHANRTSKDYYFDSYSHHGIHEEMLKDEVRTKTYQLAILNNSHLFHNKIVLDVGCGTGILSMFAAQAGAKHVYGVDCSSIIHQAKEIVKKNGFEDRITLIKGKMEDVTLPVKQVDIIISEWMGYFLLYESMLDTVLYARDKYLKIKQANEEEGGGGGGMIYPDKAIMYICGIEDAQIKSDRIDFWDNVYGFDMSIIKSIALSEPVVDVVDAKNVMTNSVPILKLDLLSCTTNDLNFHSKFTLMATRNDYIHALVAYFECAFTQVHKPVGWSTSPFSKYTHWKQTIFYLPNVIVICKDECLQGEMKCKRNKKNPRDLDINLVLNFVGRHMQFENLILDYRLR